MTAVVGFGDTLSFTLALFVGGGVGSLAMGYSLVSLRSRPVSSGCLQPCFNLGGSKSMSATSGMDNKSATLASFSVFSGSSFMR